MNIGSVPGVSSKPREMFAISWGKFGNTEVRKFVRALKVYFSVISVLS